MTVSRPRINLRRAASYNHDKGPMSSTSSSFSFNHLLFSPPPSPGLPALTPRFRKSPTGLTGFVRPSRVLRLIGWILGAVCLFYLATSAARHAPAIPILSWSSRPHDRRDVATQDNLPDFPTPVMVADKRGRTKWTVSIPSSYDFPLSISQYADICAKCREVSGRVQTLRSQSHGLPHTILAFGSSGSEPRDPHFVDVREAEKHGFLPGLADKSSKLNKQAHESDLVGESKGGLADMPVCQTSMTFVLESAEAGLGKTLMMLWTAYGVARREGRAFFIDDTRWAYGRYTDIFQAPSDQGCRAPCRHEMLPCPRQARHLVVSVATAMDILGDSNSGPSDSEPADTPSQEAMFSLARQGYDALFKLNKEDSEYVDDRVRELMTQRVVPKSKGKQNGMAIGVHVRRGDLHPLEYQYRYSYMPLNVYAEAARRLQEDRYNDTGPDGREDRAAKEHSFLVLASDDPMVYEADEFAAANRAQERIKLASKTASQNSNPDRRVMRKFVDESFGWEGGFFAPMFWNLGLGSPTATHADPSAETIRLRSLIGRAYMMDLAVLADVSDVVICTVSATGCRLLAVMMGWESAMEKGNWVNVDGRYAWTGIS